MNDVQYRFTQRGREALALGDYITELANDAASEGVVTTQGIMDLELGLTRIEAERVLSVLLRSGYIEPYPIRKTPYDLFMRGSASDEEREGELKRLRELKAKLS